MTDQTIISAATPAHAAHITDSGFGDFKAVIIVRGKRAYGKEGFATPEAAAEWATDHLTKGRLIEDNVYSLANAGRVHL